MNSLKTTLLRPKKYFVLFLTVCALSISSSAFAAAITWDHGGGTDTDWTNPLNWSGDVLPTSADQVTITGVYTVTVSSNVGVINKLVVQTSAAGAPTLVITSGGTLTVSNSTTTGQSQVILIGGIIQNAGTLNITTYSGASYGMEFRSSTSTVAVASSYSGAGTLNINSSAGTNSCIYFSQTNANPILTVGGTISLTPAATKYVITSSGGNATINGSGTLSAGTSGTNVGYGLLSISASGGAASVTIEKDVTLNSYTNNAFSTTSAPIYLGTSVGNTLTNKGTLYIGGINSNDGIYSGATTGITNAIDNQGTINFVGAFPTAAIGFGGAGTANFTNSGTILVSNMTATGSKGITISSASTVTITNTNTGNMTFDATNATTGAMLAIGDSKSKFDNTGTVTINKGYLAGSTGGTGSAAFNNNAGGKVTITGTGSSVAISTNLLFTNKGTFEANGTVENGGFAPSTGTVSPGGASGVGKITFYSANGATFSLTGKALMNVNGKTTAGTDYDFISVPTIGASLNVSGATLEMTVGGSYVPANNDAISLFAGNVARNGNFSAVTLPSLNWSMDYGTTTAANVKYSSTASTTIASGYTVVLSNNVTTSDLSINSGGTLTVNAGKQLTVNSTFSNSGTLNLLSDGTNGSATILTPATIGGNGTTTVQQYLSSARNWYVSSPLTNAKAPSGYTYYQRDETHADWTSIPFVATNTFNPGTGYIALPGATGATLTFATETGGTINTGDVTVALTYTSSATKKGFNLIGNPYPSHLTWTKTFVDDPTNAALIEPSIYYRTNAGTVNKGGDAAWSFKSYNASSGEFSPSGTTNIIPPMQAFWIRAKAAGNLKLDNKLTKSHQASNPLKTPAAKNEDRKRLRMEVSNGATTDEALIYFDALADNGYDTYDTPKFEDASAAIQIYTLVSGEPLVMNGMNSIPETEFPLAFTTTSAGTFTLKTSQFSNFEAGTQIILTDYADINNPVRTDLSADGSAYPFTSDVASTTTRFTLKIKQVTTGVNPGSNNNFWVSTNANGQIIINSNTNAETTVAVYNAVGQMVSKRSLKSNSLTLENPHTPGVYLVAVSNYGKTITKKVIID